MFRAVVCLLFASGVLSDVYLHVPRGSNNRLREQSAARTNANRLFDSQVRIASSYLTLHNSSSYRTTTEEVTTWETKQNKDLEIMQRTSTVW
jgi:hypothetical protein